MIGSIFANLYETYGDQHWWPADSAFEIMVGAILVQDTSWSNVEIALKVLKQQDNELTPEALTNTSGKQLAEWIPASNFMDDKIKRLKGYTQWYLEQGGYDELAKSDTVDLRNKLLQVNGIAKETADTLLLYAFERPVFVIDAYTRRLFHRFGMFSGDQSYEELQHVIELSLDSDTDLFNEYHALIVRHAQEYCRKAPLCDGCPLNDICTYEYKSS